MKIKYGLTAGRVITKNNEEVLTLHRVFDGGGYNLSPVDADMLARRIINALNHMEMKRQRLV